MRNEILDIIYNSIRFLDKKELIDLSEGTTLYGNDGILTSLELVMLLSDIEISIYEKLEKDIILANDSTMSMTNSPFKNVKSLADYIENIL